MSKSRERKNKNGIPAWEVVLPFSIVFTILHALSIVMFINISIISSGLTGIMRTYSGYISDVTDLQAGASYLTETSMSFIANPVLPNGEFNSSPLIGFATEYQLPRRGNDIVSRFDGKDIDKEIMENIKLAAKNAEKIAGIQLHAIALTLSIYEAPPSQAVSSLELPELTAEEKAMSEDEKLVVAFNLITGLEASNCKKALNQNVTAANGALSGTMQKLFNNQLQKVGAARAILWVVTVLFVVFLITIFFLLLSLLVYPLRGFVRGIDKGDAISENKGLAEVRLVAKSYNKLMGRKEALENVLRSAAETDALTGLPNRYHMEQNILQDEDENCSVAFFLFDVNFLKETNDKEGHAAGDSLLRRAAACLTNCFETFSDAKCFRYGGDEFVAILKKCTEDDVQRVFERFNEEQKKQNVSIAIGCAYTGDVSKTTMRRLFSEADAKMYENKKLSHKRREDV
ncbi:MAG: GGDEF domain-containing protein [Clostridia bacterium]|nr:GGDEF domain-containing protein [Clostridia bacterium]